MKQGWLGFVGRSASFWGRVSMMTLVFVQALGLRAMAVESAAETLDRLHLKDVKFSAAFLGMPVSEWKNLPTQLTLQDYKRTMSIRQMGFIPGSSQGMRAGLEIVGKEIEALRKEIPEYDAALPMSLSILATRSPEYVNSTTLIPRNFSELGILRHELAHTAIEALTNKNAPLVIAAARKLPSECLAVDLDRFQELMKNYNPNHAVNEGFYFMESLPDTYAFSKGDFTGIPRKPQGPRESFSAYFDPDFLGRLMAEPFVTSDPELAKLMSDVSTQGDNHAVGIAIHSLLADFASQAGESEIFLKWLRFVKLKMVDPEMYDFFTYEKPEVSLQTPYRLSLSLDRMLDAYGQSLSGEKRTIFLAMRMKYHLSHEALEAFQPELIEGVSNTTPPKLPVPFVNCPK